MTAEKEFVVFCAHINPINVPSTDVFQSKKANPAEPNTGASLELAAAIL
tara:strand:+ start:3008 stop:3154 length:147 start_codon:yes stop_codon:yes gene_type:complete